MLRVVNGGPQLGLGLGLGHKRAFIIIFCSLGNVKSATNMERKARNTRLKKMRPLVLPAANTVSDWPCCHHSSPAPRGHAVCTPWRLQTTLRTSLSTNDQRIAPTRFAQETLAEGMCWVGATCTPPRRNVAEDVPAACTMHTHWQGPLRTHMRAPISRAALPPAAGCPARQARGARGGGSVDAGTPHRMATRPNWRQSCVDSVSKRRTWPRQRFAVTFDGA